VRAKRSPRLSLSLPRALVVLAALFTALLAGAAPASAHAALLQTDPAEGSVVKSAPSRVVLTFSEDVLLPPDALRVLDPAGKDVEQGAAGHAADGADTETIGLRSGLGNGTYTVAWKAISADSHPVSGAFTFSIGAPSKTSAVLPQSAAGGGPAGILYGIGRYASYVGFALLVGVSAFLAVCWPGGTRSRAMRRLVAGGWATMTAATLALLLLRAPYADGTGLGGVFDLGALQGTIDTRPGAALVARLLLLAAAAVFLSVLFGAYARGEDADQRRKLALGLGAGGAVITVGIAATWAMSEHASVGIQPGVAMPVDVLHLVSMALWLGGLAALATALYRTTGIERSAVRRFSRIAFTCVCVLVATGIYQSWRQVGSWHALGATTYGRLLIVKVTLVVILVGVAALSRRWTGRLAEHPTTAADVGLVPVTAAESQGAKADDPVRAAQLARQRAALATTRVKKQRDADPARPHLRRSVLAETAIAVAVLAVSTVLSGSDPGRAVEESAAAGTAAAASDGILTIPYNTGGPGGQGTASLHLDPALTGRNELHVDITNPAGDSIDVPEVDVTFTLPSQNIGPLTVNLQHQALGSWAASSLQLPVPGQWQVAVTVRTSDIDEVTKTKEVNIG
jgi:copper transport protein